MQNFLKKHNPLQNPHIIAILLFVAISCVYSKYTFVENNMPDNEKTISQNIGKNNTLQWNENIHAGTPEIAQKQTHENNFLYSAYSLLYSLEKFAPIVIIFMYLLGFYIVQNSLKINPWSAIVGSLMFTFFTCNIISLGIGNIQEAAAISFICFIIAGTIYMFNKKIIIGSLLFGIFLSFQIMTRQYQFFCFSLLIVFAFMLCEFIGMLVKKRAKSFIKPFIITIITIFFSIGINADSLILEKEYLQYSSPNKPKYYSEKLYLNDKGEFLSLLIPNIKGGISNGALPNSSKTYGICKYIFGTVNAEKITKNSPTYFGKKIFSDGVPYASISAIFLFIFGILFVKGRLKWWLFSIATISIILSFGNLYYFSIKNIPLLYNFCEFSNILIITNFAVSLLAALTFNKILFSNNDIRQAWNRFYISLGITGLSIMLFIIFPNIAGSFCSNPDNQSEVEIANHLASYIPNLPEYSELTAQFKNDYINAIRSDRLALIRVDAIRSLIFLMICAVIVHFTMRKMIKSSISILLVSAIVFTDLYGVNKRYTDSFNTRNEEYSKQSKKAFADTEIAKDTTKYRVCNISFQDLNSDNKTFLHHDAISGNSYTKLARYSRLCDSLINPELRRTRYYFLSWSQQDGLSQNEIQNVFSEKFNTPILDMLNVKYIILSDKTSPIINTHSNGNAWFVKRIEWVNSDNSELLSLKNNDSKQIAIVNKKYKSLIGDISKSTDSLAYIKLLSHGNDKLKYESKSSTDNLGVFSEIFYAKGWNATIDGTKTDIIRADYILRAMFIPKGTHIIEFTYNPNETGFYISFACNILLIVIIIATITFFITKKNRKKYDYKI